MNEENNLESLPDGKPVRIFLPLKDSPEMLRATCLYQKTSPPNFLLAFEPGMLPAKELDISQPSIINVDFGGPAMSLEAMITEVTPPQTLSMQLKRYFNHEQSREFFRVDATTPLTVHSFHPFTLQQPKPPWSVTGYTLDISGSGTLAILEEEPKEDGQVILKISLPYPEEGEIEALAHPMRTKELGDGRFQVAYRFDKISEEDQDRIIGYCLVIQRKLLRLKVQVKTPSNQ